jgi:hypothetical protein
VLVNKISLGYVILKYAEKDENDGLDRKILKK